MKVSKSSSKSSKTPKIDVSYDLKKVRIVKPPAKAPKTGKKLALAEDDFKLINEVLTQKELEAQ